VALVPRRYLGTHRDANIGEARIVMSDRGMLDDGSQYRMKGTSNREWPAGINGEFVLKTVFLLVSFTVQGTLIVTPIVDDRRIVASRLALDLNPTNPSQRQVRGFEMRVSEPVIENGVEVRRQGVRGGSMALELEVFAVILPTSTEYLLAIDAAVAEVDIVRETLQPGVTGGVR
jgi:hypothetical protein